MSELSRTFLTDWDNAGTAAANTIASIPMVIINSIRVKSLLMASHLWIHPTILICILGRREPKVCPARMCGQSRTMVGRSRKTTQGRTR